MNIQNPTRLFSGQSDFSTIPDYKLYKLCREYGAAALEARRKFTGLLPEVFRRHLYEKKGFSSIYEFAAKLAGMSQEQVRRVLNLEQKFQAMPALHSLLLKGEVSFHKLTHIASIATPENEKDLVEKVKTLSKAALEALVRGNMGNKESLVFENQNGLFKAKNNSESVPGNTKTPEGFMNVKFMALMPKLSEELKSKLVEMDEKGLNVNNILLELLEKRKLELAQEKEQLAREQKANRSAAVETVTRSETGSGQMIKKPSRYIPAKIRHHLRKEYGTQCAIPACSKAAQHIHHTARFSLSQNHDPRYLAPLCKAHHELAHSVDVRIREKRRQVLRI